jgi:hypothetical protein
VNAHHVLSEWTFRVLISFTANERANFGSEHGALLVHWWINEKPILSGKRTTDEVAELAQFRAADRAEFFPNTLERFFWINYTKVRLALDPHLRERNRILAGAWEVREKIGNRKRHFGLPLPPDASEAQKGNELIRWG